MLQTNIIGSVSLNPSEVDVNGNVLVNLPTNLNNPGFVNLSGQIAGATTGLNQNRAVTVSSEGRPHVGVSRPIFYNNFASSATAANAIPIDAWKTTATTMTNGAGSTYGGFLLMNASAINTLTTGIYMNTYGTFPTYGAFETAYEWEAVTINCNGAANKCVELGAGLVTSATSVGLLDGFCFRWTVAGTLFGVISLNGTEYQSAAITQPADGGINRYTIRVTQNGCEFYINQLLQAVLAIPAGSVGPGYQTNPPMLIRVYNNTSAPALAPQIKIAECWITQHGMDWQKPWSQISSGMQQHASNVPYGQAMVAGGTTTTNQGGTSGGAAVPAAATGTNTAILTGCATLGGVAQMTAQVSNAAAAGNMIFFSYLVPVQTATQSSKRLVITGVNISCMNNGATVATTPTSLLWSLYWGNTAVSLATNDAANAKAPRYLTLGINSAAIGAVIGGTYDKDIVRAFTTPVVVNPGEYVGVCARFIVGTATVSQSVVAAVAIEGYWE